MLNPEMDNNNDLTTDILYSIASKIGENLLPLDRKSLLLSHSCFQHAEAASKSQRWDLANLPIQDDENSNVWAQKWNALRKFKPLIRKVKFIVSNTYLSSMTIYHMLHSVIPQITHVVIELHAVSTVLKPFVALQPDTFKRGVYYKFNLTFDENYTIYYNKPEIVVEFLGNLSKLNELGLNMEVKCIITSDLRPSAPLWEMFIEWAHIITTVKCLYDSDELFINIPYGNLYTLSLIPNITTSNQVYLYCETLDFDNVDLNITTPKRRIINYATTIVDDVVICYSMKILWHLKYITAYCKRLKRYVINNLCSDIVGLDNGKALEAFMREFECSSIEIIDLSQNSIINPGVIGLIYEMLSIKKQHKLNIRVHVSYADLPVHAICAEIISRYIPDVDVHNLHPIAKGLKMMPYERLLFLLSEESNITCKLWRMLQRPTQFCYTSK